MDISNYSQNPCINGLTKEDAETIKKIPEIEGKIEDFDADIWSLQNEVDGINEVTIPSIQSTVSEHTTQIADLYDTTDNIQMPAIESLQEDVTELDGRVTVLENSIGLSNFELDTSDSGIGALSNKDRYVIIHDGDVYYPIFIGKNVDASKIKGIVISESFVYDSSTNILYRRTHTIDSLVIGNKIEYYNTQTNIMPSGSATSQIQRYSKATSLDTFGISGYYIVYTR